MTTATATFMGFVSDWISDNIRDNGTLSDENHQILLNRVKTEELPLIIFYDMKTKGWVIALDEPDTNPHDTYWFLSGISTKADAKRTLLYKFEDHTNFVVL